MYKEHYCVKTAFYSTSVDREQVDIIPIFMSEL